MNVMVPVILYFRIQPHLKQYKNSSPQYALVIELHHKFQLFWQIPCQLIWDNRRWQVYVERENESEHRKDEGKCYQPGNYRIYIYQ